MRCYGVKYQHCYRDPTSDAIAKVILDPTSDTIIEVLWTRLPIFHIYHLLLRRTRYVIISTLPTSLTDPRHDCVIFLALGDFCQMGAGVEGTGDVSADLGEVVSAHVVAPRPDQCEPWATDGPCKI